MCGRYAASRSTDDLVEELEVDDDRTGEPVRSVLVRPQNPAPGEADYNVAPGKNARVVVTRPVRGRENGHDNGLENNRENVESAPVEKPSEQSDVERTLRLLTWGLVPHWSKETRIGMRMINARVETLLEKRSYRAPALRRRLLVPADGWYEWQASPTATDSTGKPRKQPFFMERADGAPLKDPAAEPGDPAAWLASFSIITQAAEPGLDRIHDRQPFVVEPENWGRWLDPHRCDAEAVEPLLVPAPPGRFLAHPVGRAVGSMANNGPELVAPVAESELQGVVDPATGEIIG